MHMRLLRKPRDGWRARCSTHTPSSASSHSSSAAATEPTQSRRPSSKSCRCSAEPCADRRRVSSRFCCDTHHAMSHKHENLIRAIFHDPIKGNIQWREVESLLKHLGAEVESLSG